MNRYDNGSYLEKNATWHTEDSPWKAKQVLRLLTQNSLTPKAICEIGCGAGEILVQLSHAMSDEVHFSGFDISPQLELLWKSRRSDRISFFQEDFLENKKHFDLLLFLDVIEHIEDYIGFLRKTRAMGEYKIFNFPLEIFALKALSRTKYTDSRRRVGHLHHFNREKCLDLLEDLEFKIIDHFYAASALELSGITTSLSCSSRLMNIPRKILSRVSVDLTAKLLGGYSFFVLAK